MLFNGKYYNKPGHLGMTRAELLEKLDGGGGGGIPYFVINGSYDEDFNPVVDKTFEEIQEAQNAGKVPVLIISGENPRYITPADGGVYFFAETIFSPNEDDDEIRIIVNGWKIASDDTITEDGYAATISVIFS